MKKEKNKGLSRTAKGVIASVAGVLVVAGVTIPTAIIAGGKNDNIINNPHHPANSEITITVPGIEGLGGYDITTTNGITFGEFKSLLKSPEGWQIEGCYKDPDNMDEDNKFDDGDIITEETKIYINYTRIKYTVTFKNYDGTVLYVAENIDYDNTGVEYEGETPTKVADDACTYAFDKWVDENNHDVNLNQRITSDITVYADFSATPIDYDLTFTNKESLNLNSVKVKAHRNGEEVELGVNDSVHIGETLEIEFNVLNGYALDMFTIDGAVAVDEAGNEINGYTFDAEHSLVNGETTYKCFYRVTGKGLTVTFMQQAICNVGEIPEGIKINKIVVDEEGVTHSLPVTGEEGGAILSVGDKVKIVIEGKPGYTTMIETEGLNPSFESESYTYTVETDININPTYIAKEYSLTVPSGMVVTYEGKEYSSDNKINIKFDTNFNVKCNLLEGEYIKEFKINDEDFFNLYDQKDGINFTLDMLGAVPLDDSSIDISFKTSNLYMANVYEIVGGSVTLIKSEEFAYGTSIQEIVGSTEKEHYAFDGVYSSFVDGELSGKYGDAETLTGNFTIYVNYTREWTIEFYNGTESLTEPSVVLEGSKISYAGQTPTKAADNTYTYNFAGWVDADGNSVNLETFVVNSDVKLYARFESEYIEYAVEFYDENKTTLLYSSNFHYNDVANFGGTEPTKANTAKFSYAFAGWVDVDGNAVNLSEINVTEQGIKIYASYSETLNDYQLSIPTGVIVKRGDETLTANSNVHIDDELTVSFVTTEHYHKTLFTVNNVAVENNYTFNYNGEFNVEFDEAIDEFAVTVPAGVTVSYKGQSLTETFNAEYGSSITVSYTISENHHLEKFMINGEDAENGVSITVTDAISIEFVEASNAFTVTVPEGVTVTYDGTEYTENFEAENGKQITVSYNLSTGHHLDRFTINGENAENGASITVNGAIVIDFAEAIDTFTVTFVGENDEVISTGTVDYGSLASTLYGETPTKEATSYSTFNFVGWQVDGSSDTVSAESVEITKETTLKAVFEEVHNYLILSLNNTTDTYTVDGLVEDSEVTDIEIPATFNGKAVTNISYEAFKGCSNLTSVIIGNNVKRIRGYAFSGCSSLTSITIPDSVTSIDNDAFKNCSSLASINIPESVTDISSYVFYNCSSLTSINIPSKVTRIFQYAFYGCNGLTSINIPEGVTTIGDNAFKNCSNLNTITIPDSVTYIGDYAFENCSSLTSVNIPNGVKSIAQYIFHNCSSLTSVNIPDSVTSIGTEAFANCNSLTSIIIPDSVTKFGVVVFYGCSSLTSVNIPNGVTTIGERLFYGCSSLTSVNIPDSVTSIGEEAFYGCTSLTNIYIPASVTKINLRKVSYAPFYNCSSDLKIYCEATEKPEGWSEYFNNYYSSAGKLQVIWGCTKNGDGTISFAYKNANYKLDKNNELHLVSAVSKDITSIDILSGTKFIDANAFNGCNNLETFTIPSSVTNIDSTAFASVAPTRVDSTGRYTYTFAGWVDSSNNVVDLTNYVSTNKNLTLTAKFDETLNGVQISIPEGVTVKRGAETLNSESLVFEGDALVISYELPANHHKTAFKVNGANAYNNYSLTFDGTLDITFTYAIDKYNLTFFDDNNRIITTVMADHGSLASSYYNETPTKEATSYSTFNFVGWQNSETGEIVNLDNVVITSGTVLKAKFEEVHNYLTLSLDSNSDTYTVDGLSDSGVTAIEIPATFNGKTVRYIKYAAFKDNKTLTSVTIQSGVSIIGDWAFENCSNLTSVTIPDGITRIAAHAFNGCSGITSIYIPEGVTNIEDSVFSGCNLTSVTLPDTITKISSNAFYNCSNLTSINIPNSVTSIGSEAFRGCSLTSISLPGTITSIGDYAFAGCKFTTVTVPYNMTSINGSFAGCSNLTSVTMFDTLTSIGDSAFAACSSLTSITIPNKVTSIGNSAFARCNSLASIVIPSSVTSIGDYAFEECSGLTSIIIPNSVKSIGKQAFEDCSGLNSITIPNSVTSIGNGLFYGCSGLTSVTLGNGITSIPYQMFYRCSNLTSVIIPNSVKSIGNSAFQFCTKLASVYIPESVITISASTYNSSPFCYCSSDLVIYCEKSNLWGDDNWGSYWNNYSNTGKLKVQWGCKLNPDGTIALEHNVTFLNDDGTTFASFKASNDGTLSVGGILPTKAPEGNKVYDFVGWKDNKGTIVNDLSSYQLDSDTTFTAEFVEGDLNFYYKDYSNEFGSGYQITGLRNSTTGSFIVIPSEINGMPVVSIGPRAFANRGINTVVLPENISLELTDVNGDYGGQDYSPFYNCNEGGEVTIFIDTLKDLWEFEYLNNVASDMPNVNIVYTSSDLMNEYFSAEIVYFSSLGYAYDRMIYDKYGNEIDKNSIHDDINTLYNITFGPRLNDSRTLYIPHYYKGIEILGVYDDMCNDYGLINNLIISDGILAMEYQQPVDFQELHNLYIGNSLNYVSGFYINGEALSSIEINSFVFSGFGDEYNNYNPGISNMDGDYTEDPYIDYNSTHRTKIYIGRNYDYERAGLFRTSGNVYNYPLYGIVNAIVMNENGTEIVDNGIYSLYDDSKITDVTEVDEFGNKFIRVADGYKLIEWGGYNGYDNEHYIRAYFNNIPVVEIAPNVFASMGEIDTFYIPSTIKRIGENAFADTFIRNVRVSTLRSWLGIEFENEYSNPTYAGFDYYNLYYDSTANLIFDSVYNYNNGNYYESMIDIPEGITRINDYAFCGVNFGYAIAIRIPTSVKYIGKMAFYHCTAGHVYIEDEGDSTEFGDEYYTFERVEWVIGNNFKDFYDSIGINYYEYWIVY